MPSIFKALKSQVGRKFLTSLTGLGILLFLILHLLGNLTVFAGPDAFNLYTKTLEDLGLLLYIAEAGLVVLFLYHAFTGIQIWLERRQRRPQNYKVFKSKGGPSHMSIASKSMAITGSIVFIFLIWHLVTFKFGPTELITVDGTELRDLRSLMIARFLSPWYSFGYVIVMALIIVHLSHGFWSAFISLGMKNNRKISRTIQLTGYVVSIVLMLGFIFIPLYIYFTGGHGSLISY